MSDNTIIGTDSKSKKEIISERLLVIFTIVLALLTFGNNSFAAPFALATVFIFVFYNKYLALAAYISISILHPGFSVAEVFIGLLEESVVGILIMKKSANSTIKLLFVTTAFIILIIVGMAAGTRSNIDTVLLFGFNLYLIVFIAQMVIDTNDSLIIKSILYSGLMIAVFVGYQYVSGNMEGFVSESGRLGYKENAKTLSTSVVIPVYWALYKFFNKDKRKGTGELVFYIIVFAICFPVMLLTYSRGVTIALVVSVFLLMINSLKKTKAQHFLIYSIIGVVVTYIITSLNMNLDLWFGHLEGGDGRTDIYQIYYNYMLNKGWGTIIWGIGSASMKDVLGWYPHSTILAYFFHFGIWGAVFVLYELIITMKGLLIKRKELGVYLGLFVLSVIMFSSHGSYDTVLYCIILGLCFGMANKNNT